MAQYDEAETLDEINGNPPTTKRLPADTARRAVRCTDGRRQGTALTNLGLPLLPQRRSVTQSDAEDFLGGFPSQLPLPLCVSLGPLRLCGSGQTPVPARFKI